MSAAADLLRKKLRRLSKAGIVVAQETPQRPEDLRWWRYDIYRKKYLTYKIKYHIIPFCDE